MTPHATARTSPSGAGAFERLLQARVRLNWEVALYVLIFAAAFALRFWDLGARSLHHDESIHAQWSWGLLKGNYRHDPVFHGPLYYHVQAAVFYLFGASDYTARVSAAIFGMALTALPLLLRRRLGAVGTIAAVALIAFSPTLVYYSRFFREDIYMAFFTMLMVAAMWRYLAEGRDRWLIILALAFAGSMATKEATYLTLAVFLLFLDVYLATLLAASTLEGQGTNTAWRRALLAIGLAPWAWAIAALWPFLGFVRRRLNWDELPRPGAALVLLGTLTVPLITVLLRGPLESMGVVDKKQLVCRCYWDYDAGDVVCRPTHPARDALAMGGLFAITTSAAALIGLQWRPKTWAIAAGSAALVYLTLMTSLWTNFEGLCSGPWGSLDYWISQQDVRRGGQPWFYYYMLMPAYEFLPLAIAVGGAWWSLVRGDAFSRFLWFWLVGTWLVLSMAGEKMPWLNTHLALPVCILAAWTVARAWRAWESPPSLRRLLPLLLSTGVIALGAMAVIAYIPGGPLFNAARAGVALVAVAMIGLAIAPYGWRAAGTVAVVAVVGALAAFSLRTMVMAVYERGDVPKDLLIYTQSSPQITDIADQIDQLAAATGKGFALPIAVDSTDSFAWPWAWYLRDYTAVAYMDFTAGLPSGEYAVLLVNQSNAAKVNDSLEQAGDVRYGSPIPYPHRWWFDETYRPAITTGPWTGHVEVGPFELPNLVPKRATWETIGSGIFKGRWLPTVAGYWRDHDPGRPSGSVDALAYFPVNFDPATGNLTSRPVEPPKPTADREGRPMFGGIGSLPGQFVSPVDVETDSAGNLYVIDRASRKLQKFDAAGNFVASADVRTNPADPNEGAEPWGLEVGPSGTIIVADTFGWRVRVFDRDLKPVTTFGGPPDTSKAPGPYDLYGPRDAAVDAEGNVWVTDTGHGRVMVYTVGGQFLRQVGERGAGQGQFDEPVGIDIASDGSVLVADMYNRRVQILDSRGNYVGEFRVDGWGGQDVKDKPYVRALRNGTVAVSLPALNQVRVYNRQGQLLHTIAPSEEPLNRPYGIVETPDGKLWVSEGGSGRLRLFTLQ
ncbi:TIGR03663 family protein [bacterium]|nr:MAG: TIGR03663 family protein [bacterium]MCL4231768.1 TIGR03663 family protein [Dehalococcoidia bacterium]